jgi:hypothetical protein
MSDRRIKRHRWTAVLVIAVVYSVFLIARFLDHTNDDLRPVLTERSLQTLTKVEPQTEPGLLQNRWVIAYLAGCVVAFACFSVNASLLFILSWMTKANVLKKNLKKLQPDEESTFINRILAGVGVILLETAFSWIAVLFALWTFFKTIFDTLREIFSSTPEAVQKLRFPLKNNPNMSREAVWAHYVSLAAVNGEIPTDASTLVTELDALASANPALDRHAALMQLKALHVVDADVVAAAIERVDARPAY